MRRRRIFGVDAKKERRVARWYRIEVMTACEHTEGVIVGDGAMECEALELWRTLLCFDCRRKEKSARESSSSCR
jgi:predicted RNA-binding protein with PIN domain